MGMKKRFFSSHAKSSAALVSLAIHAILIIAAFSFVAVKVITKADQSFEAKTVNRPKMEMKKLQVPVDVKKQRPKPKLRKRIVAKPRLDQSAPDISMPEISGIKGGVGASGSGLGDSAGIGFSMPEIEIFGVKGKGEKIVLVLGADDDMMLDEMGGIEAFRIIKDEMIRIVEELPSSALFNVFVYEGKTVEMAFPVLVPANAENAQKMKDWISPLNAVRAGMGDRDYGLRTLGEGGVRAKGDMRIGKFADLEKVGGVRDPDLRAWFRPSMLAHKMQADTIFILTDKWDVQRVAVTGKQMSREDWDETSAGKKWNAAYKKALKTLDEENRQRKSAGKPPKIISRNEWDMRHDYYPDLEHPPTPDWYYYTPKDFAEGFVLTRNQYRPASVQNTSGLKSNKSRKIDFSYNVIQFVPKSGNSDDWYKSSERFNQLTNLCKGDYKTIAGLAEIQSYVSP